MRHFNNHKTMTDTAEYWNDIKSKRPYLGKDFRHNANHKCSHYSKATGNTAETIYIEDINCHECLYNLNEGISTKEGLKEGKAPETYYMSDSAKKAFNKRKAFNNEHGVCDCGHDFVIRTNKSNGEKFLGCSNYPKCKKTKQLIKTNQ